MFPKLVDWLKDFENIPSMLFGLVFLIIPLLFCSEHLDPVLLIRMLAMGTATLGLLFFLFLNSNLARPIKSIIGHPISVLYLLYALVATYQLSNSINIDAGLLELTKIWQYYCLMVVFGSLFKQKKYLDISLKFLLLLGPILGLISLWQFGVLNDYLPFDHSHRAFFGFYGIQTVDAVFANENVYSFTCIMLLCLTLPVYKMNSKFWKGIGSVNLVIYFSIIAYLQTISAFLILPGVAIFLSLILYFQQDDIGFKKISKKTFILGLALLIIGFLTALGSSERRDKMISGVSNIISFNTIEKIQTQEEQTNIFERTLMIHNSLSMIKDHWATGVGLSNWKIEFQKYGVGGYQFINEGKQRFQRPHNEYLHVFSELGIVGFLCFIGFILTALITAYKTLISPGRTNRHVTFSVFAAILSYSLITGVSYPRERIFISILMFTALGILLSQQRSNDDEEPNKLTLPILSILSILSLVVLYWQFTRYAPEKHMYRAFHARLQSQWHELSIQTTRAHVLYVLSIDPLGIPLDWYQGTAYMNSKQPEKAMPYYMKAVACNPYCVNVLNDIAGCYIALGALEKGEEYYKKALQTTPLFPTALMNLAIINHNKGETVKAYSYITKSMKVPSSDNYYHQVFNAILRDRIRLWAEEEQNADIKDKLLNISENETDKLYLFNESLAKHTSFEFELLNKLRLSEESRKHK